MTGKVAVITGAASGIGRGLADVLAGEGMRLVLADIEESTLEAAGAAMAAEGAAVLTVPTDVSDSSSVAALAAAAIAKFGGVHVVCNNAGVSGTFGHTWTTSEEEWRWVLDVNIGGVINGIRTFVPILVEQNEGHVVNTGSAAGFEAFPGMGPYAASKHALIGLSEALRRELSVTADGVGVSVLIPGGVVKSAIMSSERNWLPRLGGQPGNTADPLGGLVRSMFTQAIDNGVDPHIPARAALEAIYSNAFLASDDPELLATWGEHHARLAQGEKPTWPPAPAPAPAPASEASRA